MDIRLYTRSGTFKGVATNVEIMNSSTLDEKTANYLETLSNKVVKFLLTSYGSDPINPQYGARVHIGIVPNNKLNWFSINFQQDLKNCYKFIKNTETPGPNGELMADINLLGITAPKEGTPTELAVKIEIKTTDKQSALLHLKKKSG